MKRKMTLIAVVSALMLMLAACEVDDADNNGVEASDDTIDDVVTDDDDASDDAEVAVTEDNDDEPTPEPEPTEAPEPTPEPEPEPTATPEPEPDLDPEIGTRDNPIALGEMAQIGDWELRVVEIIPNATDVVLEENQFNDPPDEGHQFFISRIEATYVGEESSSFWLDITLNAVDEAGVVYEGMDSRCGVIPDNLQDQGEAFTGATIEGNTCRSVQSEYVDSLLLIAEPMFSFDRERIFFALAE
jgi:hypothetical protein